MIRAALLLAGLTMGAGAALAQPAAPGPASPPPAGSSEPARPAGPAPGGMMCGGSMCGGMAGGGMTGGRMGGMGHGMGHAMGGAAGEPRAQRQERIVLEKGETRIVMRCGDAGLRECMTLAIEAYERMNTPIPPTGAPAR